MRKTFIITLIVLIAAACILLLVNAAGSESYVGKTRTPVISAEDWSQVYAVYANAQQFQLLVDDQCITDLAGSYMAPNRDLMLEKDVVRDAFDCSVRCYDDGRVSISKGSLTLWANAGSAEYTVYDFRAQSSTQGTLDTEICSDGGNMFIPAQLLIQGLGYTYNWSAETMTGVFVSANPEISGISSYYSLADTGKITYVRNQENLGACWAFASIAALEYTLQPGETWDFSEDHMIWNNPYDTANSGGDYLIATAYLTSWKGPVTEEDDPYNDGTTDSTLTAVKHVQEVQFLPSYDFEAIKKMVFKYGVVESSVYIELSDDRQSLDESCYNPDNYSYIYTEGTAPNHEVVIIGWDDNYPKENFAAEPAEDGAFICKNSWGSGFGDNGVFYVSYEDTVIGRTAVAYTRVEDVDNYDRIYQLDNAGMTGHIGYGRNSAYMANVYTADGDERLAAVGFYATGENTSYKVYVCTEYESVKSLDVDSKVYAQGTLRYAGYYTIDLNEEADLTEGGKYAVIVEITTPGSSKPVAVEIPTETSGVDCTGKESYISSRGTRWDCTQKNDGGNVCLKAYTRMSD